MKPLSVLPSLLFSLLFFWSCTKDAPSQGSSGNSGTGSNTGTGGNSISHKPPVADAGPDQTLILPQNAAILNGERSFDSLGRPLYFSWRIIDGPASTPIKNPNSNRASVSDLVSGIYRFELRVSVNTAAALDTTVVTVKYPAYCQATRPELPATLTWLGDIPAVPDSPEILVAGNKLIIPQGYDRQLERFSPTVNIYDINTRNWSAITLQTARDGICTVIAGDKIYFAGGVIYDPIDYRRYTTTAQVDIYDLSTNTWSAAQLHEPRGFCKAAVAGNKVVFAGGLIAAHSVSSVVDILDLATNTWSASRLPGTPRALQSTVTAQNRIYFCGGFSKYEDMGGWGSYFTTPVTDIDVYDANTGQWSVGSMRKPRTFFSALSFQQRIYLAGGEMEGAPDFDVEILDAVTQQSTNSCLSSPTAFYNTATSCVRNNDLFFFQSPFQDPNKKRFDIFHTQTGTWSVGVLPASADQSDSYLNAIAAVNNTIYVVSRGKLYSLNI